MVVEETSAGFGRGKVILLGEHAVVYGHPALAAGVERGVVARAHAAERDELRLPDWGKTVIPLEESEDPLARAFAEVLSLYPDRHALAVEADIALPAGAGLGCSAALGVAVLGAIDEVLGVSRTPSERGELALRWEKVFHGNPSGIDNMMAACGGLAIYTKGQSLEVVRAKKPLHLVIADSGHTSSTKEMVESVARQFQAHQERIGKTFEAIASLVRNGRLACIEGDHDALGQLLDLNHFLLSSLMLCTTKLDRMCQTARTAGALGAKMTGAGGGGCIVALAPDPGQARTVLGALEPISSQAFVAEVGK